MTLSERLSRIRSRHVLDSLHDSQIIRLEIDLEEKKYDRWFAFCSQYPDSINELFHRAVVFGTNPSLDVFLREGVSLRYDYALNNGRSGNILFVCLENDQIELFKKCLYKDSELFRRQRSDGANLLEAMFERVEEPRDIPSFEDGIYAVSGFINPKKYFTVRRSYLPKVIDPQFRLYSEMVRDVRKV